MHSWLFRSKQIKTYLTLQSYITESPLPPLPQACGAGGKEGFG